MKRIRSTFSRRAIAVFLLFAVCFTFTEYKVNAKQNKKPLEGKTISVLGDSISTYMGWSDALPITDGEYRYGEPYYGPQGADCHNTELTVEDTWWHQAATELGAEILVSNAGNSTGVLVASYPYNIEWENYLKDMLAYKTRPYHLGTEEKDPDIIALYIGSSDLTRASIGKFGSVAQIDFDSLIKENSDGSFTYATPVTVAEAYSIMLHKITVTYPNAEVYCFGVVPSAGGTVVTCNTRLKPVAPFNRMIEDVASYYGAIFVDLFDEFGLDPDGDGKTTEEAFKAFASCYNNDPHPNAKGFDVITQRFVNTVLENSRYLASVEPLADNTETVPLNLTKAFENGTTKITGTAKDYLSLSGASVDCERLYQSFYYPQNGVIENDRIEYSSQKENYSATGGSESSITHTAPLLKVNIPLTDIDDPETEKDETLSTALGSPVGTVTYIKGKNTEKGTYDYSYTEVLNQGSMRISTNLNSTVNTSAYLGEGMDYILSNTFATDENNMLNTSKINRPQSAEDVPAITPGYDYIYIGSDQVSNFWAAYGFTNPDPETETPYYKDDNISLYSHVAGSVFYQRKLTVPTLYLDKNTVVDKYYNGQTETDTFPAWYDSIQQFTLSDRNGNLVTAYCADQLTNAEKGYCYKIENVNDASHYSDENADMIRSIAINGYWGTESGTGSLVEVRKMMLDAGKFTEEEAAALTDGMAMTATQYAIWTYSNHMDNMKFINAYYTLKSSAPNTPASREAADLIFKLYHHLIELEPTKITDEDITTANTIINEQNFLNGISLKITGKPDVAANSDADKENDVYTADISFDLKVKPEEGNEDDLLLYVEDSQGDILATGRVAGAPQNGEQMLYPDGNGLYTFKNLSLTEGEQNIHIVIAGTQNIKKDAFIFTSEVKDGASSQTFVSIAMGERHVNVIKGLNFSLNVDDELTLSRRVWRTEKEEPSVTSPNTEDRIITTVSVMCISAAIIVVTTLEKKKFNR